ncbi:PDF receptor-like [Pomacea canaliculata]|uniref:PDF receptor-like n=1 Tax=Pomacea canaliculata TaxID=400727 RepID=UPI000D7364F8|nr:PDF receptor-like [Pomacea canaliculata]
MTTMAKGGNNTLSVDSKTPMRQKWVVASSEECISRLGPRATLPTALYCNATWDTVLCWPAALPNTTISLPCPALNGLDPSKYAYRHCGPEGVWQGREPGDYSNPNGYTFYSGCYTKEAWELYTKYLSNKTPEHSAIIKDITGTARTLEIVGLCVSLVSTILSLVIFCYFRSLKCHRTRIHKNLFVAISVQIAMRIFLCVDQYIARKTGGEVAGAASGSSGALYDTPVFCEILYSLLEYTKTVKFMWMFVEGLYLHNMIAVAFFSGKPNYVLFYSLGWGFPVLLLIAWVVPMSHIHKVKCWFAYYYMPLIWILEGPRAGVMAVNLGFLLNIIRVLVMKLRETHTNEAKKVRKQDVVEASDAGTSLLTTLVFSQDVQKPDSQTLVPSVVLSIRPQAANAQSSQGAIILLPLLGLTNFVIMLEPVGDDNIQFSVWIFSAHFLTDFEGFFISLIYCFLNGEVQSAVKRHLFPHLSTTYSLDVSSTHWRNTTIKVRSAMTRQLERWRQHRLIHSSSLRRLSRSFSIFTSFTEVANPSQANGQMVCTVEANGDPKNGGGTTNGQVPLLRSYKRRLHMRRSSTRDGVRRQCQASQPLRTETVQEQEI